MLTLISRPSGVGPKRDETKTRIFARDAVAPPTAAAPSLRKSTRSTQNADALRRLRRHSTRSPHTADHSPQPCTNVPRLRLRSLAARNGLCHPARKTRGLSRENTGGFREKAGNFFETNGDFASLSSLMPHLSSNKINKTTSSHSNITVGVLIRGGYKKLVSFLFGQQGRDVYFCGVLQQYYTETLHTMMI